MSHVAQLATTCAISLRPGSFLLLNLALQKVIKTHYFPKSLVGSILGFQRPPKASILYGNHFSTTIHLPDFTVGIPIRGIDVIGEVPGIELLALLAYGVDLPRY